MTHRIEVTADARKHLEGLSGRDRATVLEVVREQVTHEPARPTRNRKLMRANPLAPWVLRVGHLRVYYEVTDRPLPCVTIRAIGVKIRDPLLVAGVEIDLS